MSASVDTDSCLYVTISMKMCHNYNNCRKCLTEEHEEEMDTSVKYSLIQFMHNNSDATNIILSG